LKKGKTIQFISLQRAEKKNFNTKSAKENLNTKGTKGHQHEEHKGEFNAKKNLNTKAQRRI
jgi:hypothetical protein